MLIKYFHFKVDENYAQHSELLILSMSFQFITELKIAGTTPFTCFDGEVVIEVRQLCDGTVDCPGEEDETLCGGSGSGGK